MVLRHDRDGVLAVGQPAHAWLCGQLARAWGNARFGAVTPRDEVALGAEQHDVGMAAWDLDPALNPETGLPQSFMEMAPEANAALWRRGPVRLVSQSRYAALLAMMHGRRLYERHDLAAAPPARARAIRVFLEEAEAFESAMLATLRADPHTAPFATPEHVGRNSRLVWTWDSISLALLLDWAPMTLAEVPTADGATVDVAMEARGGTEARLDPWPFPTPTPVRLHCEGRRLTGRFDSQTALARGLADAPWESVTFTLSPEAGV
jgi:hypothetical protein